MPTFTIGAIAQQMGIATSTIRYYESIGLLPPAPRVSGKRRYDESVLSQLGAIRLAQQAGLTLAEIQRLFHEFPTATPPSSRWQALAPAKLAEVDALLVRLHTMKQTLEQTLHCTCATLAECGRTAVNS